VDGFKRVVESVRIRCLGEHRAPECWPIDRVSIDRVGHHQLQYSIEMGTRELSVLGVGQRILAASDADDAGDQNKDPDTALTQAGQNALRV
jgi:hypothetical protein